MSDKSGAQEKKKKKDRSKETKEVDADERVKEKRKKKVKEEEKDAQTKMEDVNDKEKSKKVKRERRQKDATDSDTKTDENKNQDGADAPNAKKKKKRSESTVATTETTDTSGDPHATRQKSKTSMSASDAGKEKRAGKTKSTHDTEAVGGADGTRKKRRQRGADGGDTGDVEMTDMTASTSATTTAAPTSTGAEYHFTPTFNDDATLSKSRGARVIAGSMTGASGRRRNDYGEFEIDTAELHMSRQLGSGHFSQVFMGHYRGMAVAVKVVKGVTTQQRVAFHNEAEINRIVEPHRNVVRCLGVCSRDHHRLMIITEYCALGSLNAWLRRQQFVPNDLKMRMSLDAARGLRHLHKHEVIHRDVACRNFLLAPPRVVKVADLGLGKCNDIDFMTNAPPGTKMKVARPIRWMSPEALAYRVYSEASDVWSFGVAMWEIQTGGGYPYGKGLPNPEIKRRIVAGQIRLDRPRHTPPAVWKLIDQCHSLIVERRPSFDEICTELELLLGARVTSEAWQAANRQHSRRESTSSASKIDNNAGKPRGSCFHLCRC